MLYTEFNFVLQEGKSIISLCYKQNYFLNTNGWNYINEKSTVINFLDNILDSCTEFILAEYEN